MDTVNLDLSENGLPGEERQNCVFGSKMSETSTPYRSGNMSDKRRCYS